MDTISHALWSSALFRGINSRIGNGKEKFNLWWAAFWGMFPDIFSQIIPGIIFFIIIISQGEFNIANISNSMQSPPYSDIIWALYQISHSIVIFTLVFLLIWVIFKKPSWILGGWLLHILIDIPTHVKGHFATPFLWPISNFSINGIIYWREPVFMLVDISLLIIVYSIIYFRKHIIKKRH